MRCFTFHLLAFALENLTIGRSTAGLSKRPDFGHGGQTFVQLFLRYLYLNAQITFSLDRQLAKMLGNYLSLNHSKLCRESSEICIQESGLGVQNPAFGSRGLQNTSELLSYPPTNGKYKWHELPNSTVSTCLKKMSHIRNQRCRLRNRRKSANKFKF